MPFAPRFVRNIRRDIRILRQLAERGENLVAYIKYLPGFGPNEEVSTLHQSALNNGALPVPPRNLWIGYGDNEAEYVESGRLDVARMREILASAGLELSGATRPVLDLGCGAGRMVRHLEDTAQHTEVWGLDISGPHINWLKSHLRPPFHFALNTTIPHLPFSDGYFGLVYCGSLFTHVDDLAESWFLEVRRVLHRGGLFYCTVHDEHTVAALQQEPHHPVANVLRRYPTLVSENPPDVLVTGHDVDSTVFYRSRYLRSMLQGQFEVVATVPRAYGYQSAWLLRNR
jgi:ubiquinone/menaquinone biosynthesis C-methylase UbiE